VRPAGSAQQAGRTWCDRKGLDLAECGVTMIDRTQVELNIF
jgi:hypothetical protein